MNWYLLFYLYSIADNIRGAFLAITVLCLFTVSAGLLAILMDLFEYNEAIDNGTVKKWCKRFAIGALIFGIVAVFIPSKKDLLLIVAGGAVGEFITTNPDVKQLPADVTKFLRAEILSATAELNPAYQAEKDKLANTSKEDLVEMLLKAKADTTRR